MLKGIEKITAVLNKAFKEFDVEFEFGTDFCYDTEEEKIYYTLIVSDEQSKMFMNDFTNKMGRKGNLFIASILHELGHNQTGNLLTQKEINTCIREKKKIQKELEKDNAKINELTNRYFNLIDEFEATAWAVDYYIENLTKMKKLEKEIEKAICNFYQVNNITE